MQRISCFKGLLNFLDMKQFFQFLNKAYDLSLTPQGRP